MCIRARSAGPADHSSIYLISEPVSSAAIFPSCSSRVIWNRSDLVSLSFLRAVCSRVFRVASSDCRAFSMSSFLEFSEWIFHLRWFTFSLSDILSLLSCLSYSLRLAFIFKRYRIFLIPASGLSSRAAISILVNPSSVRVWIWLISSFV